MKTIVNIPSRQNTMRELRDYLMIALGMVLYGIGWTVFLLPNDITTGGVPGIASIVYFATGFPVQYTYFAINFLLLLLALRVLGWKFSVKTIFAVFTLTFFLSIIQKLTEGVVLLHDQPFMACVIGASFCGSGIGIGCTLSLTVIGAVREVLGSGALFGMPLGISDYTPLVFVLAPGGFLTLGYLMVLFNKLAKK